MVRSETEICNIALGLVGGSYINTIDEESANGVLCRRLYYPCRDATLEVRDWSFAKDRAVLTPDANPPAFGFGNRFKLPANCIRVTRIGSNPDMKDRLVWEKEERYILVDLDVLYIKYIARIVDVSLYSSTFVTALAQRLASDLAIPIAQSRTLQKDLWGLYVLKIEESGTFDGMQGYNKKAQTNSFIRVR